MAQSLPLQVVLLGVMSRLSFLDKKNWSICFYFMDMDLCWHRTVSPVMMLHFVGLFTYGTRTWGSSIIVFGTYIHRMAVYFLTLPLFIVGENAIHSPCLLWCGLSFKDFLGSCGVSPFQYECQTFITLPLVLKKERADESISLSLNLL